MAFAGANQLQFPNLQAATVDIGSSTVNLAPNGARVYLNDGTFPSTGENNSWSWSGIPAGAAGCVSFRPSLFELVNPGQYPGVAATLDAFLTSAPAGPPSLLALWHEASGDNENGAKQNCGQSNNETCWGPGGAYSDYFASLDSQFPGQGGAKGLLLQAQSFVQQRVHALNQANPGSANVKVGAVEVVSKKNETDLANTILDWMAPGLDFYACDVYDSSTGTADPAALLTAFQQVSKAANNNVAPAAICVTETNSRFPGRRPFWFTSVWSWLQSNGYTSDVSCFLTYWNYTGVESGPWIPDDWATIDSLYGILAESSA